MSRRLRQRVHRRPPPVILPVHGAPRDDPTAGNRAIAAAFRGTARGGAAELDLGPAPEPPPLPELFAQLDASTLGLAQTLPGHAFGQDGGPATGGAPTPSAPPSPDAVVTLTVNSPTETRKPEADISADHGRPNVAGWTTPSYAVAVPGASSTRVTVDVTLDFEIELATEFSGTRLDILKDHEMGHVEIGTGVARVDLVDGLEASLEALPAFTGPTIQALLGTAASNFVVNEGIKSQAYDAADYPRMQEAYLGARTPLRDLAAGSEEIANLAEVMHDFAVGDSDAMALPDLRRTAKAMDKAWDGLTDVDAARVQYNPEFKTLVEDCEQQVTGLLNAFESDDLAQAATTEDVAVRGVLEDIQEVLGRFEWEPPL